MASAPHFDTYEEAYEYAQEAHAAMYGALHVVLNADEIQVTTEDVVDEVYVNDDLFGFIFGIQEYKEGKLDIGSIVRDDSYFFESKLIDSGIIEEGDMILPLDSLDTGLTRSGDIDVREINDFYIEHPGVADSVNLVANSREHKATFKIKKANGERYGINDYQLIAIYMSTLSGKEYASNNKASLRSPKLFETISNFVYTYVDAKENSIRRKKKF